MELGIDDELVEHVFRLTQAEQQFIQRRLKQSGLNVLQAQTLNFIATHPASIQRNLSHYLGKSAATTTNILKVLEARQLITRRADPDNSREKRLYLLPAGQDLVTAVRAVFIALERRVSAPLTPPEKTQLLALLDRISAQADFD
ncbi:MarR family winged helix-turn-helix transcriptional regulator [Lacticaseibacillus nasuensis]|uniref:HTH marR-type domain-containing protein n=1 Tax=Lacticaseibacillus nasuensis JCM 17158 TaxID=1291734 RepID=A0A0R1JRP8_9LACO|nr:MarR family winged helix-turn-helix transcriptional regulator [Lacticaseibacillus nasuensis]KRK73820.1 hypothetical protein FD02_GL001650 [Lacticaseibacillus nasuensis JCM 17158]